MSTKTLVESLTYAVASDEPYAVHQVIVDEIERRGHKVVRFGSIRTGQEALWSEVAAEAAGAVANGTCHEGVIMCWTGTGISMAANKVAGIRAALCTDPETARGARIWNHANVLALSNRLLSEDLAREILAAWFETPADDPRGRPGVEALGRFDGKA